MPGARAPRREPERAYRLMVWTYQIQDLLGIGSPRARLEKIPLRPGVTVVDWGCGPGRYTIPVARLVGREGKVLALDVQPLALEIVAEKAARESLTNVGTLLVDSYSTPFASSSVDLVLLIDTFHGIGDPGAWLREVHRLLKPDGLLFMDPGHTSLAAAREAVEGSGLFTVAKLDGDDLLLVPRS